MRLVIARFIGCVLLVAFFATSVAAQSKNAIVDQDDQVLRKSPNGEVATSLKRGTPVRIIETKDDWTRVSVEGWIRGASLRAADEKLTGATSGISVPVEVVGFSIEKTAATGTKVSQAQLILKVRNNLSVPLAAWKAILVVQKHPSDILFSSAVSDDRPFAAGSTADVKYYWEDGEEQYTKLTTTPKEQIKVNLLKVEVTKQ